MNCIKLSIIFIIILFLGISCNKKIIKKSSDFPKYLPLEVLNRKDTISMNDSIVFYIAKKSVDIDSETGIAYDWKDLNLTLLSRIFHIEDSIPFTVDADSSNLGNFFDYKIELGTYNNESNGIKFSYAADSIHYKCIFYPKQIGLFLMTNFIKIPDERRFNERRNFGILLAENDDCILIVESIYDVFATKPEDSEGSENYNNFDMYYNSSFFDPGSIDINDIERLREIYSYYYFVYVE